MKKYMPAIIVILSIAAFVMASSYISRLWSNSTVQTRIDHPRPGIECYGLVTDKGAAVSCYPTKGL